jgi:hypothetical protein
MLSRSCAQRRSSRRVHSQTPPPTDAFEGSRMADPVEPPSLDILAARKNTAGPSIPSRWDERSNQPVRSSRGEALEGGTDSASNSAGAPQQRGTSSQCGRQQPDGFGGTSGAVFFVLFFLLLAMIASERRLGSGSAHRITFLNGIAPRASPLPSSLRSAGTMP